MTKITCGDLRCKYYKNGRCTAKEINLTSDSIMTLWQGRQDYNTCKTFELSEHTKKISEQIDGFLKNKEMTFEDCLMQLKSLKVRKERLQSAINEIVNLEKDLILNIADPELYKKIKGDSL